MISLGCFDCCQMLCLACSEGVVLIINTEQRWKKCVWQMAWIWATWYNLQFKVLHVTRAQECNTHTHTHTHTHTAKIFSTPEVRVLAQRQCEAKLPQILLWWQFGFMYRFMCWGPAVLCTKCEHQNVNMVTMTMQTCGNKYNVNH